MLDENIKQLRKAKGLSQEELAIKLNVVRQTVSKWENGLSVPDSSMLISLADEFGVSVSDLLGEAISESASDELRAISEKLEVINLQLSNRHSSKVKTIRWLLISLCAFMAVIFIAFAAINGSYMDWNYNNPELAVAGTILHGFEIIIGCRRSDHHSIHTDRMDDHCCTFHNKGIISRHRDWNTDRMSASQYKGYRRLT